MTSFEIRAYPFDKKAVEVLPDSDQRYSNWPAVYTLRNQGSIYVGESGNVAGRLRQHLASGFKDGLQHVQIVLDDTFNKSAALDLEAFLIQYLSGDSKYSLLNRNKGIVDGDYYNKDEYRQTFRQIFDELREQGLFERTLPEIENDDLFKLSPFKALTPEQSLAVESILRGFLEEGARPGTQGPIVVQGDPGTGKTVVAVYLMKLLIDIATAGDADLDTSMDDNDARFAEFFTAKNREKLANLSIGLVIPQQSLRATVEEVFKKTPYLEGSMVLDPFSTGAAEQHFDVLVVDEAHRLNRRANQPSAMQNTRFAQINHKLFGNDDSAHTQWDWIKAKSTHQILFLDRAQSVRPADLPASTWDEVVSVAREQSRHHRLHSQLRVRGGRGYIEYVRAILRSEAPRPQGFPGYEIAMFSDFREMHEKIRAKDAEHGLSRLVAGYAWKWVSKKDSEAKDIELDGYGLQWNRTAKDWINSKTSLNEVGSIHTVQGYDLNYAGVLIGPDLRYDEVQQRIVFSRDNYFDTKGKENNPRLGITYSDEDLLEYVTNIYSVLLTRAIRGTYVYVCDPPLRRHFSKFFVSAESVAPSRADLVHRRNLDISHPVSQLQEAE
ncbi:DNA/RNA helicase domain-containing protein [Nesterenkonia rhizosphaerae]|uniref:GIY-YIG domain-containing protein n=1 Tax=Nesterenkonia rhizosphaerae TaxID=1348272 RepID=A0ABP9FT20_9MICC